MTMDDLCEFWEALGFPVIAISIYVAFVFFVIWCDANTARNPPTECRVKTTERGNRLHIVLDCPMIPSSALEASTDEK